MKNSTFTDMAKADMPKHIRKAIDDLLEVLDSEIVYPRDKFGEVVEFRLLKVVQSREQVVKSIFSLMDMVQIDKTTDNNYKNKLVNGFKTTWKELVKITIRNIGGIVEIDDKFVNENDDESILKESDFKASISDDYLSVISKSKEISAQICMQIMQRVATLENPEQANKDILEGIRESNIAESYAIY